MSLVEAIFEALEEYKNIGAKKVGLRIGALRQVEPDIMSFCFEAASAGTPFSEAKLVIESVPIVRKCCACAHTWQDDDYYSFCSKCQSPDTQMLSGMELEISYIDYDEVIK